MRVEILIGLVEDLAWARDEEVPPRDFITDALERITNGKEEVRRYPTGLPSAKEVADIAIRLYNESRRA